MHSHADSIRSYEPNTLVLELAIIAVLKLSNDRAHLFWSLFNKIILNQGVVLSNTAERINNVFLFARKRSSEFEKLVHSCGARK